MKFRSTRDVILRTSDLAKARAFYTEVLGFATTMSSEKLVGFETGAIQLFVETGDAPHAPVFELLVDDVAAAKERLIAAGCAVIEEDPSVPRCYVRDPFGYVFNVGPS